MKRVAAMMIVGWVTSSAQADPPKTASAAMFDAMLACRSIADGQQRLACFDGKVAALQDAQTKRDIVVVDREQMHKTHASLFGFSLPNLDLFGDRGSKDKKDDDDIREITEPVKSASRDGAGSWVVVLASGATWHQTEGMIALAPKVGANVTIRRGTLGSYFMRVGSQPGVKVRRER